jgi:hypothetical protein
MDSKTIYFMSSTIHEAFHSVRAAPEIKRAPPYEIGTALVGLQWQALLVGPMSQ